MSADAVIWHDLECGGYRADLPHWLTLAARHPGTVLDIGAGTGRVAIELARAGHHVVALERDAVLAAELDRRATELAVEVLRADACSFSVRPRVPLAIVPMQTIHLFEDLSAFLRCTFASLQPRGVLAVALLGEGVEPFELELEPDTAEFDAVRYESTPTALRRDNGAVLLERRRTRTAAEGTHSEIDLIRLADCDVATLTAQAQAVGFEPLERHTIAATLDHAGSEIVCLAVPA
jgi:SAM-dependent methyltransferase